MQKKRRRRRRRKSWPVRGMDRTLTGWRTWSPQSLVDWQLTDKRMRSAARSGGVPSQVTIVCKTKVPMHLFLRIG